MSFNSIVFIFYFLPFILIGNTVLYLIFPRSHLRLLFLIFCSLIFYFWSTGFSFLILVVSAIYCYLIHLMMWKTRRNAYKKIWLWIGIASFIGLLAYYKYNPLFVDHLKLQTLITKYPIFQFIAKPRALLLGVSFFSFQAISYLVETYRSTSRFSLLESLSYFTFFPKLLQGPIARFSEIRSSLNTPHISSENMFNGWVRFCLGLGKKVILADSIGVIANAVFAIQSVQIGPATAWIGIIAYTFQIFLDFSGYTDMAIGIATMLGVTLPENFTSPYTSSSITEFWNRWHMTLSRWLRDYVYIPLGGSRKSLVRALLNIMVVFIVSGLWHGTGLQYLVWGIYHGLIVSLERIMRLKNIYLPKVVATPLTFIFIMMSWVFFRSPTLSYTWGYFKALASLKSIWILPVNIVTLIDNRLMVIFFLSILVIFTPLKLSNIFIKMTFSLVVFIYAVSVLATSSFTPFLYFQY